MILTLVQEFVSPLLFPSDAKKVEACEEENEEVRGDDGEEEAESEEQAEEKDEELKKEE